MTADVKVQLKLLGHLSRPLIYSSQNVLGLSYEIQCVSSVREGNVKKKKHWVKTVQMKYLLLNFWVLSNQSDC